MKDRFDKVLNSKIPTKITAIGFVISILTGNFILLGIALDNPVPRFVEYIFIVGIGWVIVGGSANLIQVIFRRLR